MGWNNEKTSHFGAASSSLSSTVCVPYLAVNARRGVGGRVLRYGVEADVRHVEVESLRIVLAAQPHYSPAHLFRWALRAVGGRDEARKKN